MSENTWYIDPDAGPVAAEDDENYDEAYGPADPSTESGRIVEDDEGVRADTTKEAVGHLAGGDTAWKSAEESAIHVVDEAGQDAEDLVDLDELPADPDERE
jgi:hypothetical protein